MCRPCMKRILRKNLNCEFYFKLFFNDQNNSKFNISHNLSLKCVKASSLNSTHLRFPIVSKACPNFHKKKLVLTSLNFLLKSCSTFINFCTLALDTTKPPWCTPTHRELSNTIKSMTTWQEALWFGRSQCDKQTNKQTTFLHG